MIVRIKDEYMLSKWDVTGLINKELSKRGINIEFILVEQKRKESYDDYRVYRTNERQLDTRIDGRFVQR